MEERIRLLVARIDAELSADRIWWYGPSTVEAIASVEEALSVRLPASFRIFLLQTGGGGNRGLRISGVPSDRPVQTQAGTVYGDTVAYRESWVPKPLPNHLVVVQRCPNDNEPFCLDTSNWTGEECPVVLYGLNTGHVQRVAPDFPTFWEGYLAPHFEAAGD